jgi:hypothetical protein
MDPRPPSTPPAVVPRTIVELSVGPAAHLRLRSVLLNVTCPSAYQRVHPRHPPVLTLFPARQSRGQSVYRTCHTVYRICHTQTKGPADVQPFRQHRAANQHCVAPSKTGQSGSRYMRDGRAYLTSAKLSFVNKFDIDSLVASKSSIKGSSSDPASPASTASDIVLCLEVLIHQRRREDHDPFVRR